MGADSLFLASKKRRYVTKNVMTSMRIIGGWLFSPRSSSTGISGYIAKHATAIW
jgi:hypothetical protein